MVEPMGRLPLGAAMPTNRRKVIQRLRKQILTAPSAITLKQAKYTA
jgi:hypothetical protein